MRTDIKDRNALGYKVQDKKTRGGCFSTILYAIGVVTILVAIVGYILSFFDMVLVIQGNKLPMIDLGIFIALMVCALIFLIIGWLISKLEAFIRRKKEQKNQ